MSNLRSAAGRGYRLRVSCDISPELVARLNAISVATNQPFAEVMRTGLAKLADAWEARRTLAEVALQEQALQRACQPAAAA
jgi:ABC-type amino acid transport system permease subunit